MEDHRCDLVYLVHNEKAIKTFHVNELTHLDPLQRGDYRRAKPVSRIISQGNIMPWATVNEIMDSYRGL